MADYPATIYEPRTKENAYGVVYDAAKTTIGYAEDVTKLDDEVVAIETELGLNPSGTYDTVADRLDELGPDGSPTFSDLTIHDDNASGVLFGSVLHLIKTTSSTPVNGFGTGHEIVAEHTDGDTYQIGWLFARWTDISNKVSSIILGVRNGAATATVLSIATALVESIANFRAPRLEIDDASHYLDVSSNEIAFTDPVNGTKKVSELGGGISETFANEHYAGIGEQFVVISTDGTLTDARVLAGGNNIALTDGGAGGDATLDAKAFEVFSTGSPISTVGAFATAQEFYNFLFSGYNDLEGTKTYVCKIDVTALTAASVWTVELLDKTNSTTVASLTNINSTGIKTLTVTAANVPSGAASFCLKTTRTSGNAPDTITIRSVFFQMSAV